MNPGKLRHRVEVQAETATPDEGGGWASAWTTAATVWAMVEPLSGRERMWGGAVLGEVTHRVTMRYRAGLTPANRLVYAGRVFDLLAVRDPDERREWLECDVREVVA